MSRFAQPLCAFALLASFVLFGAFADAQDGKKEDKKEAPKTDVKKDDVKKDEPKKDDVKKADPKKKADAKKKDEPKKDEPKKDDKKADPKKEEVKEEPKKEPFVPDAPLAEMKGHKAGVNRIAFVDDGKVLVSVGNDRTIRFWDFSARKEREKDVIKDLPTEVKALAVGGGKIYATTGKWNKEKKGWEGEIKIIDAATLKPTGSLKGHTETIEALALSTDGKTLASASEDHSAKLWNLADGKDLFTLKSSTEVSKVDPKTKKETKTTTPGRDYTCLAFSRDGKTLVAGNLEGNVKIIDVDAGKETGTNKAHGGVWALAISPDGSKIATGGWDQTIKVWDAAGKELSTIKAHNRTVTALVFSPDNQFIVSGDFEGSIKVWPAKK